ncbi:MAG TPA: hypothetical protein VI793_17195 [Anaerolineales bacterium]|nr:hypothetical protein [Anaerolineales bacterium]
MITLTEDQHKQLAAVSEIAEALRHVDLDQVDLQPTSRAYELAASAALSVLLAHELGQTVSLDVGARLAPAHRSNGHSPKARRSGQLHKKVGSGTHQCLYCPMKFTKIGNIARHIKAKHPDHVPAAA